MNPFEKYLTKEDVLQKSVLMYLRFKHPHAVVAHPTNEGKRTPFEQFKIKYLGIGTGIQDLLIFEPNHEFNGLAIELKIAPNKPSENQKDWNKKMNGRPKWFATYAYSLDEAMAIIDMYFKTVKP